MYQDWNGKFQKTLQGIESLTELLENKETIKNWIEFAKNFIPEDGN